MSYRSSNQRLVESAKQRAKQLEEELAGTSKVMQSGSMALPDPILIEAEVLKRNFNTYFRACWKTIEPGVPFLDNWHVDTICDHLQAVTRGQIQHLIINIPPRTLKSSTVGVAWPTWEWIDKPSTKYLTASHAIELATRDAVASRMLIQSPWYQERFGMRYRISSDQNVKSRYTNDHRGHRIVTSVGAGVVGEGGNRGIIDDPHDPKKALSDEIRGSAITWHDHSFSSRLNDQQSDSFVIIMQRVHALDLTGHLLKIGGYEHLCLPMEYDGVRRKTKLGEYDVRKKQGELLFPRRFPKEVVNRLKTLLGSYAYAAQYQQSPSPIGGGIFERNNWKYYTVLPHIEEIVISVDCAFKDLKTSDYVAIQAWGRMGANKYLLHRVKAQMGFGSTVTAIRNVKAKFPTANAILVEDKANGPAVIETLRQEIPGVIPVEPEGGKVARAYAAQPEHESGNLWLPSASIDPDIETFVTEHALFPNGPNDDEVDAQTQMTNYFRRKYGLMGLLEYYKAGVHEEAIREDHRREAEKNDPKNVTKFFHTS